MYNQLLRDGYLFTVDELLHPTFELIKRIFQATMNVTDFGTDIYELYLAELHIADPKVKYREKEYPIVK